MSAEHSVLPLWERDGVSPAFFSHFSLRGGCEADRTSSIGARATQNTGGGSDKNRPRFEVTPPGRKGKERGSSALPHHAAEPTALHHKY